jgi:protocatechuate 3,4-dioxygenase beta subunit
MRLPAPLAITLTLLLCCAFCPLANSQTTQTKKAPEATVSGKVTIKGKPAPEVVVGLRSSQPAQFSPTFKATTDQDGNYRVGGVPAGSYVLAPVTPAFVISDVNNSMGQTVVVADGENIEGMDFDLVRGGVITGKVTDADGSPLVEEHVNLLPLDQRNQRGPVYSDSLNFVTDDRGIYRMFGIRPGHYKVSIGEGNDNFYGRFGRSRLAFRTTFYPDATDPDKATVIKIEEGTVATKIDIALSQTVQSFSVTGRIVDESEKPVPSVSIGLSRIISDANNFSSYDGGVGARSDSRGEFRLENLTPGKYSISISPPPESAVRAEPVTFDVIDQDVTGLLIKTSMGGSLSGTVVIEGTRNNSVAAALAQTYISAYVRSEDRRINSGRGARLKPDGSFMIGGLQAGTANFSLYTMSNAKGFAISRVERDGVVQPNGIELQNAEQVTGIRLFVSYRNGSIRGVVKLENGKLPSGGSLIIQLVTPGDQFGNWHPVDTDSRGHFLLEGLAAGSYELRVTAYVPESRQRPPTTKQSVTVADGVATEVTVTLDLSPTGNP